MSPAPLDPQHAVALQRDAASRAAVIEVLRAALRDPVPHLSDVLATQYARQRLAVTQRALVAAAVRAVVRHRTRLAHVVEGDDPRALLAGLLVLSGSDDGSRHGPQPRRRGAPHVVVDAERARTRDAELLRIVDPVQRAERLHSLPPALARLFADEVGAERLDALCDLLNRPARLTLRANRARIARDELIAQLVRCGVAARSTRHAADGIVVDGVFDAYASDSFRRGLFEVQDEGSQLVAEIVAPPPRGLVVDACAGAGGKTLALGALLNGRGRLVALEPSRAKLTELRRRTQRAELSSVRALIVALGDAPWPPELAALEGRADRVLCDVPCTGLGVLRRNPEARWRFDARELPRLAALQRAIVHDAARLVAPGGRLVYATCSFLRRECEDVVGELAAARPDFVPVSVREVLGARRAAAITDASGAALRTWEHALTSGDAEVDADGFYAAVLRRKP